MPSPSLQKEYQTFCELLIGDNNQIKGSDARLYAIKLAQFSQSKYEGVLKNYDIPAICTALTEIIRICYSTEDERSPKQVLRLYNQCFQFGLLVTHVIEKPVKLSVRKFFVIHFHSLVIHFPEIYHLFCLQSLMPEDEERTFGDLRSVSEKTSNRQAPLVVDNCMLRYLAKEKRNDRSENFKKQESMISKQARLLPDAVNTIIPASTIKTRSSLMQAHCRRISDFLVLGENVWWYCKDGHICFLDGPEEPAGHSPSLRHFRSSSLKEEYSYLEINWANCIWKFENKGMKLTLQKIKVYKNGKLSRTINTGFTLENNINGN
jgi:hypothetical protein